MPQEFGKSHRNLGAVTRYFSTYREPDCQSLVSPSYIIRRNLSTTHTKSQSKIAMTSTTVQPELVQDSAPDLLICDCIDGVIAIGRDITFLHIEPLHNVISIYSQVFNSLVFLKTDASTEQLIWLAARQYYVSVLWMLAEPTMSPEYRLIRILAIAAAEAVAVIEARGLGDMDLDNGIRCL